MFYFCYKNFIYITNFNRDFIFLIDLILYFFYSFDYIDILISDWYDSDTERINDYLNRVVYSFPQCKILLSILPVYLCHLKILSFLLRIVYISYFIIYECFNLYFLIDFYLFSIFFSIFCFFYLRFFVS